MRRKSIALLALCASLAAAQDNPVPLDRPVRVTVPPRRIGILARAEITLEDVLTSVLANNHDIEASRIERQVANIRLNGARGAYDLRIGTDGSYGKSVTPVASALGGGRTPGEVQQRTLAVSPSVSGLIPKTGGNFSVNWINNRISTDNIFSILNPQFPTSLGLSVTQPLWRGLRYDDARRQIDIGKKNNALTDEQFRQRVIEISTQAINAYWDLVFAYRNEQIQAEAVDLSRRQVESNQRQAQQGILAPIDVVEADTQLSAFELTLYAAQQNLTRAENALKAIMLLDRSSALWNAALIPVTPANLTPPDADYTAVIDEALAARPEIAQLHINRDVNQANVRFFKEQTRPQVDLVASYTAAGLAGQTIPGGGTNIFGAGTAALTDRVNQLSALVGIAPLPPTSTNLGPPAFLVGGYGQSLSNLAGLNYPTANAGLRISLPLRNRVAESNLAASVADSRRIDNQRAQLELRIEADVRDTMQAMETAKARLVSARLARQSAEQQYQSEQRKFQEGTSSAFLVVQRQTLLITGRTTQLRAEIDVSRAIADFERASARTLAAHQINIQGAANPAQRQQP